MFNFKQSMIIVGIALLTACGGKSVITPDAKIPASAPTSTGKGGYYLDDGPGDNAPADIDRIPDAQLKTEKPLARANKPYSALGQNYVPMTNYAPYVKQGIASWYGKRYHGKKTSSGETYDMYAMSGAHTTLPIPSYVKVTNPANGRSVVVRINDRGPFKHDRLIDLSYVAAYKLHLIAQGSGLVKVEWIDTSPEALRKIATTRTAESTRAASVQPVQLVPPVQTQAIQAVVMTNPAPAVPTINSRAETSDTSYYVQVGAFKNAPNGDLLQKKILDLDLANNATVTKVYNDGLYRVKLGPFDTRQEADISANKVRKQLNMSAIVTNQ